MNETDPLEQWEYKFLDFDAFTADDVRLRELNKAGADGWEFVQLRSSGLSEQFLMKRLKASYL